MASVDNRIVSMQFDNADFERKVQSTIESLGQLQKSLDFSDSKKSLSDLGDISKGFSLSNIGDAVEDVSKKFIALSTIAITALANITSKAIDAGLSLVKSLSLDPIMDGFHEWETNMNSIQTIMANTASKGTNLDQVNAALDQLNTYSDQTIYNFGEMARNIGTFTAAGVDLDTSVNAIKGIANLAAISGSSSEQASTAMYQLSQAIAAGSVKLMDWNSIVNAGMGGEVFQKALFETGKSLKTIKDVPIGMTFEEWTKAGNTFRGSLEDGWLTSQVLTNTLQSFTGDLTAAQLTAMGYTQQQAEEMLKLGQIGKSAATEVKTLSQLLGTVKESVGSGWSASFRIIFGNFEEAKTLFTGINNAIGEFVGKSADARNALLQGWKDLGGRTVLIEALYSAFHSLSTILKPIKEAFHDIFPPATAQTLMSITNTIKSLADGLAISGETAANIKSIFSGLFSIISIGWNIIKNLVITVHDLIMGLSGVGGGALDFAAKIGDFLTNLQRALVEGGGIADFFQSITRFIKDPLPYLKDLRAAVEHFFDTYDFGSFQGVVDIINKVKDAIVGFFSGADSTAAEGMTNVIDRIKDRWSTLGSIIEGLVNAWNWLLDTFRKIEPVLKSIWNAISTWFSELGAKLAEVLQPGDFNKVLDAINVGLLGGLVVLLKKFLDNGLKLDFGGGMFESIKTGLDNLNGTLTAMQTSLKADALLKIAEAIGILAVSLLVLSLIDSDALTKALTAMAISFGQLVGSLALLNQMSSGVRGGMSLAALSAALVELATAVLILSVAVKILSTLSWEELAKGLLATTVLLGLMIGVAKLLEGNTIGMIAAGIALTAIAVALNLMAIALKVFATMSWGEMLKGMVGMAGALLIIAGAMQLMPVNMLLTGAGLVAVGIGLNLIAASMKIFGTMSWEEMAKGLVAIAGGLLIIAAAMNLMPITLPITAVGLILVGVALGIIAGAMKIFATMDWGEIAKGLAAMAATLLILAIAANAMTGAIVGAAAIVIVASAMTLLVAVLKELAKMKIADIVKALIALAAIFVVIGLAALVLQPVIPAMLALGAALFLVGAGLALFGIGAYLAATAFKVLAEAGTAGIDVLMHLIDAILTKLPQMIEAFAMGIVQLATTLLEASPILIDMLGVLIVHILETLTKIAPALGETLIALLDTVIDVIRKEIPNIVQLGYDVLLAFLNGINDNIGEIVTVVMLIISNFIDGITAHIQMIIDSAVDLLVAFLKGISDRVDDIIAAGLGVLLAIIKGIGDNLVKIANAATEMVTKFINAIGDDAVRIATAGADMIIKLIKGFGDKANDVVNAGVDTVISFITGLGQNAVKLANAAGDVLVDFLNGMADAIRTHSGELRKAGENVVGAIIDGMTGGLASKARSVADGVVNVAKDAVHAAKGFLQVVGDPYSLVFMGVGESMMNGMSMALNADTSVEEGAVGVVRRTSDGFQKAVDKAAMTMNKMAEFNPTITPVLDLTQVQKDVKALGSMLDTSPIVNGGFSYTQAQTILADEHRRTTESTTPETPIAPTEIKFEQNNYSPAALSTNDIYRNTRNQIALAREELAIA